MTETALELNYKLNYDN